MFLERRLGSLVKVWHRFPLLLAPLFLPFASAFLVASSETSSSRLYRFTEHPHTRKRGLYPLHNIRNTPGTSSSYLRMSLDGNSSRDIGSMDTKLTSMTPLLTLGIIADIQYAPIDDGYSFSGTPRYYRHALAVAAAAATHFQNLKVDAVVNLGDLCDGKAATVSATASTDSSNSNNNNSSLHAVDEVLSALSSAYTHGPILHTYGNHCLYNMDRSTIQRKLGIPFVTEPRADDGDGNGNDVELVGYYSSQLGRRPRRQAPNNENHVNENTNTPPIRLIVLDAYDICMLRPDTSPKRAAAYEILLQHNRVNVEAGVENSSAGLEAGLPQRFVGFNGAVGPVQLQWLRKELAEARSLHQMVIVVSHPPLLPGSTNAICLVWNYEDVVEILQEYADVVALTLAGHAHKGGYRRDETGWHARTIEAVLESPAPVETFATMEVYDDRIVLHGHGACASAVYELDHHR